MGQRDLSRRALADLAGINHVTLGRRIIDNASWDIDMLDTLARVFDVDLNWLLTGLESVPRGGIESPLSGLNRRPLAYKVASQPAGPGSNVIDFPSPHHIETTPAERISA